MLSCDEYRLFLNSYSSSFSPNIFLLMSLIDPCNVYIQGDILFALLVVRSAFQSCGDSCGYTTYGLVHYC
jgi:hypothetical protein